MADQKDCPFCGESIKATAKKCRYCLEFLDGFTREQIIRDVTTGGGANIGRDANVNDGDLVGRDKINIDLLGDNKIKQYEAVLAAIRNKEDLYFVGFDLSEQNLAGFPLRRAKLNNANLRRANLRGADLFDSNLSHSDLRDANLSGAFLSGANLNEADLRGANLRDAILGFTRADFVWLGITDLRGAKYNFGTVWPNNFNPERAGAVLVQDN